MGTNSIDQVRIAFVVRASVEDGLGHLVRSLCVIRELHDLACVQLFLLGDLSGRHLVQDSVASWDSCQSDEDCARLVLNYRPQIVVFDTLRFEKHVFDKLVNNTITISLSPVFSCLADVGYIFHRTIYEPPWWKAEKKFPKVYKGLQYTVLPAWLKRVSTRQYQEHLLERKLSIAISMGGTDAPNRTLALLQALGKFPQELVIWVALGDAYTHSYEDLLQCAQENRQEVILLKSNESMWRVLRNVSLVICAGGLTTYEAAFVGIPSINILQSSEWDFLFSELVNNGVCYVLNPVKGSIGKAAEMVSELASDRGKLQSMHQLSKRLIPSGTSRRVARKIFDLNNAI